MTEELTASTTPSTTAGALLRQYRETQGFKLDVLAQVLRVSPAKLKALEEDRLDELPDAMFARALSLAVCRQLKTDAAPVLALLPGQDVSRLASRDERGLDFPLERPSFLPQSSLLVLARLFTPLRGAAFVVLAVALVIGFWPEVRGLLALRDDSADSSVIVPVISQTVPMPVQEENSPMADVKSNNMVVTTVLSATVAAHAASAAAAASAPGTFDGR